MFNIRRQRIEQRSDNMESELLSVAVVKVRYLLVTLEGKVWSHQDRSSVQVDDFLCLNLLGKNIFSLINLQ